MRRALHRAQEIRMKLGGFASLAEPFPAKPKGMHWSRYLRRDDARASAALQVIGDLANQTQVLFFTHHRRLAELGIRAGAQMIELGSETKAVA
jgi:hypothetical protein